MNAVGVVLADLDESQVTPGLTGFIATFVLALAVVALMLFFVRDLRKVNRAFARRDGTSATSTALSNDRTVEASIGSAWPYPDEASAVEADRAGRLQGVVPADPAPADPADPADPDRPDA